jgi:ABC-type glycerol-3-phosphate transport system substrate-binding protein
MMNTHSTYYFNRGSWYGRPVWDDARRQAFVNDADWIKGAQFWVDVIYRYRVVPTAAESRDLAGGAASPFVAGKAAMMYTCCPHGLKDVPFRWGMATLPYSGPAGSKNMSGRIHPHALHVARSIPADEADAVWTLFKWYMAKPEQGGLMPPANSHIAAPYRDPRYSDIALQEFEQLTGGVSGRAPLLTAQNAPQSSGDMSKYDDYNEIVNRVTEPWRQVDANELAVRDFAVLAQKAIEDARLGSRPLA